MKFQEEIKQKFGEYHITLTTEMVEQFFRYYQLLITTNEQMNLTAITEQSEVIVKHFLDSCLAHHLFKQNAVVMDIGCGAGFPSIPLKIIRPDLQFVLVDSLQKRTVFLKEVCTKLNLQKVTILHSRAEDLAKKTEYREKMDYVVARAVAKLPTLIEYCLPFVAIQGNFIAYKSNIDDEIEVSSKALAELGGELEDIQKIDLYEQSRCLIVIKKVKQTPAKYPRNQNKPRTNPLLTIKN